MVNQPTLVSFFSFPYALAALYWVVGAGAYLFYVCRKKKVPAWLFAIFIFGIIVIDLLCFSRAILPSVTMERGTIPFQEKSQPFSFPTTRLQRLYFRDQFRYFRPAIEQKFTAFDSTILVFFDRSNITAPLDDLYASIMDGEFPLLADAAKLSPIDFLRLGKTRYELWDNKQKFAYLSVLENILQSFVASRDFYLSFDNAYPMLILLNRGLSEAYAALPSNADWAHKDQEIALFEKMLKLELKPFKEAEQGQYILSAKFVSFDTMLKQHLLLYHRLSTVDFLTSIFFRFQLHNVNSFVRFKDYDRFVDLFLVKKFEQKTPAIRKRFEKDLGFSEPMLQFFPCDAVSTADYFSLLEQGKIDQGKLYLTIEQVPACGHVNIENARKNPFQYTISKFDPNRLEFFVTAPQNGFLYWSDGYDPHWQVSIDGANIPIFKANGAFKAVPLYAGAHQVRFVYNPLLFRLTLWFYYGVSLGCGIFLIRGAARFKKITA